MKKIGILFGQERSFPEAFVEAVNAKKEKDIVAEFVHIDKVMQAEATEYAVIIDRISQDVPFYKGYLKNAAIWDEVKDRLHDSALGLSGGQAQRICIARAIAVNPEIILMDEPCSALDPISTLKIEELIDELKQKYTIIIVTHNMQQAARVSDVTAFFYLGELIEAGQTSKIFTNPEKKQTEDYITGRFG